MRLAAAVLFLILLAGCAEAAPPAPPEVPAVSVLDLADDAPPPPSITEQVKEAEARNEGGLTERNQAKSAEDPQAH